MTERSPMTPASSRHACWKAGALTPGAMVLAAGLVGACQSPPPAASPPPPEPPLASPEPRDEPPLMIREGAPEGLSNAGRICQEANECVLSRFNGCCSCPRPEPYAIHRQALAANEARCAGVDCDEGSRCSPAKVDDAAWEATCQANHCVARRR